MKKSMKITALALAIVSIGILNSCKKCELKYTGVPSQIISVDQGIEMKKTYNDSIAPLISRAKSENGVPYDPTEFAYVELDTLKKYIAFLEEVERLNKKEISGIRIYFGAYPNKGASKFSSKNPGRETMFFAPTMTHEITDNMNQNQRQFDYLRNVPFYIQPKNSQNKYVGEFKAIEGLMFSQDYRPSKVANNSEKQNFIMKQAAIQGGDNSLDNGNNGQTSLIMNELNVCPPPKR